METFSERKRQRITKSGIGFLLQQMRGSTRETDSTDDESGSVPSSPKREKVNQELNIEIKGLNNLDILPENAYKQVVVPKLDCENISLPLDEDFYYNLKPFQEISDCFNEGTTPNFSTHICRFIGENNYVRSCKWYLFLTIWHRNIINLSLQHNNILGRLMVFC